MTIAFAEISYGGHAILRQLDEYIIPGSIIKLFSCYNVVQVGCSKECAQLLVAMLVKLFLVNNLNSANPWCGMVNWLENACNLHLCNVLFVGSLLGN